jgi:hypothetical protein
VTIDNVEQDAQIATVWTVGYRLTWGAPRTLTIEAPHRDAAVAAAVVELRERFGAPLRPVPWAS